MISIERAKQALGSVPRAELGFFPTPFYKLERLSEQLGIHLWIKRDDFTGRNLFGGNKTRKLTYLMGEAKEKGYDYVFTFGATQSNHAMQTAWSAIASGLKPILYLVAVVEPDPTDPKANLLLDRILGAEVHVVSPLEGESFIEADKRCVEMAKAHMAQLESEGHKCYYVPMGGASDIGTVGYIEGFVELSEQAEAYGVQMDYVYHATGSGGTMAGLVAGKRLLGSDTTVVSVAVLDTDSSYLEKRAELANEALAYIGQDSLVEPSDFELTVDYYAPGYERPSDGGTEAIRLVGQTEGLFLDPVYTAKAFAALLDHVRTGKIKKGSHVAFLHTGGTTALFAEKAIIGAIY